MRSHILILLLTLGALPLSAFASSPSCESMLSPSRAVQALVIGSRLKTGEMREFLKALTGVAPLPSGYRLVDRRSDENRTIARAQIVEMIRAMGYENVALEPFMMGANIIVELPGQGRDDEVLEISAHYDSVDTGGDDNGSGVALLLGMLSLFRECEHERRIRFVFSDLEERGRRGMEAHVENLIKSKSTRKFIGSIIVDTIGWAHPESKAFLGVMEVGTRYHFDGPFESQMSFGTELNYLFRRIGQRNGLLLSPETTGAMPGTTDLGAYWGAGLPAVLIAAAFEDGFTNPEYHRAGDTLANMNWEYYHRMSTLVVEMVAYFTTMKLRDLSQVSLQEWQVATSLENKSLKAETFKLEPAAIRTEALDEKHLGPMYRAFSSKPEPKKRRSLRKKSKLVAREAPNESTTLVMFSEGDGPLGLKRGVIVSEGLHYEINGETPAGLKNLYQSILAGGGRVVLADWIDGEKLEPENVEAFLKAISMPLLLRHIFTTVPWKGRTVALRDLGPYVYKLFKDKG